MALAGRAMVYCMPQAIPLPDSTRRQIADLFAAQGERKTVAQLGIARQTLARALACLPLNLGTHALIEQRLAAGAAPRHPPPRRQPRCPLRGDPSPASAMPVPSLTAGGPRLALLQGGRVS